MKKNPVKKSPPTKKPARKKPSDESSNGSPYYKQWPPFLDYYRELSALRFETDNEIEKGIELLWTDDLRTLPHDLVGDNTIIVPKVAVVYFSEAGLKFVESRVRSISELSGEEAAKLRSGR